MHIDYFYETAVYWKHTSAARFVSMWLLFEQRYLSLDKKVIYSQKLIIKILNSTRMHGNWMFDVRRFWSKW